MSQIEKRIKLTPKQYTTLENASKRLGDAQRSLAEAQQFSQAVSDLILDSYNITPNQTGLRIDETTKELVYFETSED